MVGAFEAEFTESLLYMHFSGIPASCDFCGLGPGYLLSSCDIECLLASAVVMYRPQLLSLAGDNTRVA